MENKEEKAKEPDVVIDNSGKEFKAVKYNDYKENQKKEKSNFSFTKTIGVPFLCGVLGAGVVLGTCFGIPEIKDSILGNTKNGITSTSTAATSNSTINTQAVSLVNYSETGIAVAQKVLPSIVGITVEYPVSSIFMNQSTTATASGS